MIDLSPCAHATVAEFVTAINKARLRNKGFWFTWRGLVAGNEVELKNYNTYLQIYRVNGLSHASGTMEMSITDWKAELENAFR